MNQIDNLKIIYNGNDREVMQALKEKASWISHKFLVPGNLKQSKDEAGKTHFDFIEALYDGCFIFDEIKSNLEELSDEENKLVAEQTSDIAKLILYSDFDENIDTDFWCEFDFTKIDRKQYNQLFPNFYNALPLRLLDVNFEGENLFYECIKCVICGKTLQNSIILSKNDLFNYRYHCPILTKIYVKPTIERELLDTLEMIAEKYNATVEEIDE